VVTVELELISLPMGQNTQFTFVWYTTSEKQPSMQELIHARKDQAWDPGEKVAN
jgi:hypothetical protein